MQCRPLDGPSRDLPDHPERTLPPCILRQRFLAFARFLLDFLWLYRAWPLPAGLQGPIASSIVDLAYSGTSPLPRRVGSVHVWTMNKSDRELLWSSLPLSISDTIDRPEMVHDFPNDGQSPGIGESTPPHLRGISTFHNSADGRPVGIAVWTL